MRDEELKTIDQTLQRIAQQMSEFEKFTGDMRVLMAVRERLLIEITEDVKKIECRMDKADYKLENLVDKIGRWEARVGGILFVGSALWAFVVMMKDQILAFFKGAAS